MSDRPPVAYLIMSYTLPDQVLRLVRALRAGSPGGHVVIHHDACRCSLDRRGLQEAGAHSLEPAVPVRWGDFSQLAAVLRGFAWLLENTDFEWLVLLSGQDYPLRPVPDIERDLRDAPYDAFIETRLVPAPPVFRRTLDEFPTRYFYRYAALPDRPAAARLAALV
ncbi:MAG: hypothetical protein H0T43_01790, partial [Solirubrobacterales bacterium]|nr:hypothetical protein [Solirubrobacterales bacterium]